MDNTGINKGLTGLGIFISIAAITSTWLACGTIRDIKLSDRNIYVKGVAEKTVASDLAVWNGTFSARSTNMVGAYDKLQNDLGVIKSFLAKKGINNDQVEISSISSSVVNKKNDKGTQLNEIDYYVLNQGIKITTKDVAAISMIANEFTSLIKQNIELTSYPPAYFVSSIEDSKLELLGKATDNARMRAEILAKNSGKKLGDILSASQGVFQITAPNSTDSTDYGCYDTSTINKNIRAVVTVNFSFTR